MSHRVTTETEMKDKNLTVQALKNAGLSFQEVGSSQIRVTSGRMNNATIDLNSGRITGDTDHGHDPETLGMLRQFYGEAKYRAECTKQGISIESRTVEKNGTIVLMCSMG
jgi:hypothetical protein